jgi:O-antigen ligase
MSEHLRALIVILVLSTAAFAAMRHPAVAMGMTPDSFTRRRNLWLATTLAAFLAPNFVIFAVVASGLLLVTRRRERNPLSLYLFLLFVVPPFSSALSGLGIVNQLFELNFPRLLSLLVLLPWAAGERDPDTPAFGKQLADWLLLCYVLLQLYQQLQIDTFTNTLRYGFYAFLDVLLPYYVASRSLKTTAEFREALLSFVVAVVLMAPIAAFEFVKHWLLYAALGDALGMQWSSGRYLGRGETLRAVVTAGHSIALGYVMMIAIMLHSGLRLTRAGPKIWALGMIALAIGSIATVSRGPWVGIAIGLIVFSLSGKQPAKRLMKLALVSGLIAVGLLASPWGSSLIDYLPFVGSIDSNNISYRRLLFAASMLVISQHPFFGSPTFMLAGPMQELQNGNLIDVVNSYLLVALQTGYIGLTLFVAFFVCAASSIIMALRSPVAMDAEHILQGRALLAALAAILVSIATTSPISFIPVLYWCVGGLCVSYGQQTLRKAREARETQWNPSPFAGHLSRPSSLTDRPVA